MRSQGHRRRNRIRSVGTMAALAVTISMALPGGAHALPPRRYNLGGGAVAGRILVDAPGLPPAGARCLPTRFTLLRAVSPAFVLNTVITGYLGVLNILGSGTTLCGSTTASGGLLTLNVSGLGPTGSEISCGPLLGGFTRVGPEVLVQAAGLCTVNRYGTGPVQFVADLAFIPTLPVGAGVTAPVLKAEFAGVFAVVPAT